MYPRRSTHHDWRTVRSRSFVNTIAIAAIAGCASPRDQASDGRIQDTPPIATGIGLSKAARATSNADHTFVYRLDAIPYTVAPGDSVKIRLVAFNRTASVADFRLAASLTDGYDILVRSEAGELVWTRRQGRDLDLNGFFVAVSAGDSLVFNTTWDLRNSRGGQLPPGRYWISAQFPLVTEYRHIPRVSIALRAIP